MADEERQMDTELLKLTHRNLMAALTRCREQTVSDREKLELLMFSLAEMSLAMAGPEAPER
jgi:hypothetical protein